MPKQKLLQWLLLAGIIICFAQVWIPHYYLTGDGPCHLYNARVLHDIWGHSNAGFYSRFYKVTYEPNPNWLSHVLLALSMYVFNGVIAEKVFLSVYILLMAGGFYLLNKRTGKGDSYWLLLIFLLVFNHPLAKGFYNFVLATAFYLWMVLAWIRFMEKRSNINAILFFCVTGGLFFAQLLPFVFGLVTCFALTISYAAADGHHSSKTPFSFFIKHVTILSIFAAPFVFLMLWFISKEHGLGVVLGLHPRRLVQLIQLEYLVSFTDVENYFTAIAGIVLAVLFIVAVIMRLKEGIRVNKYDGFLISLVFVSFVYLLFPESFLSRVILMSMRAQLFMFILLVVCCGYILPVNIRNAAGGVFFVCFLGLTIVRFPVLMKASDACADYNSAINHMRPNSVVLPLDFAPAGKDEQGKTIANHNYLFSHAAQYGGTQKALIFLDNYEANTGYFPLVWQYNANPYAHLSTNEGIEAQPPSADITGYEKTAGVNIDYILLWCYDSSFLHKGNYAGLDRQIQSGYHMAYTSGSRRAILYERNR